MEEEALGDPSYRRRHVPKFAQTLPESLDSVQLTVRGGTS
jgi:Flp pilus assembly protein TadB